MKIGLISDTSRHLNGKTLAGMIFANSPWFRYSFAYCEKEYDQFYILSAKYGLISHKDIIESYDEDINSKGKKDFQKWLTDTTEQIRKAFPVGTELYFHTGRRYRKLIHQLNDEYKCFVPMKGLAIGQQMQKYKELLK